MEQNVNVVAGSRLSLEAASLNATLIEPPLFGVAVAPASAFDATGPRAPSMLVAASPPAPYLRSSPRLSRRASSRGSLAGVALGSMNPPWAGHGAWYIRYRVPQASI